MLEVEDENDDEGDSEVQRTHWNATKDWFNTSPANECSDFRRGCY